MQKRICSITPTYRIMGEAAAAGVSRRRNPQERLNRDSNLKLVENSVTEMPLYPFFLNRSPVIGVNIQVVNRAGVLPPWVFYTRLEFVAEDRSGSFHPPSLLHSEPPGIGT